MANETKDTIKSWVDGSGQTVADLAELSELSRSTVGRYLKELQRDGVVYCEKGGGRFDPAKWYPVAADEPEPAIRPEDVDRVGVDRCSMCRMAGGYRDGPGIVRLCNHPLVTHRPHAERRVDMDAMGVLEICPLRQRPTLLELVDG